MCGVVLIINMIAMHGHVIAGLPHTNSRTDFDNNTRRVTTKHLIRLIVALGPFAFTREALHGAERRDWFKNAGPHRVEVDAARHHCDVDLVWR